MLGFAKQDPEVVSLITGYSKIVTWSVLPALWWVVLRNYVTALAKSAIIGWVTFSGLGLNVALNYTLIYGKFGLPALGVVGAGIGTTIVTWLMFFALAYVVLTSKALKDFRPRIIPHHIDNSGCFLGCRLLRLPIFDQLEAQEQSSTPDITDDVVLCL